MKIYLFIDKFRNLRIYLMKVQCPELDDWNIQSFSEISMKNSLLAAFIYFLTNGRSFLFGELWAISNENYKNQSIK